MPRLSIVIPCVQDGRDFENTLASVLQNRPKNCEVLVVQPRPYDDPYSLSSEVRFLETAADLSTVELINIGVRQAKSDIIHLLGCNVEATASWTEPALLHFDDASVASVTPQLVSADCPNRVIAAGVGYELGGRRRRLRAPHEATQPGRTPILGPTLQAGFYRRQAILDAGGFCSDVGESFADIDMAITMWSMGQQTVHEAESTIMTFADDAGEPISFQGGLQSERLFWRNAAIVGWPRALAWHSWTVVSHFLTNAYRPSILSHAMGRLLASTETTAYKMRRCQLETAQEKVAQDGRPAGHRDFPEAIPFHPGKTRDTNESERTGRRRPWRSVA